MNLMETYPCIHCGDEEHTAETHEELLGKPEPTPVGVSGTVSVDKTVLTNEEAADYGAYTTLAIGVADQSVRILGHDNYRSRVVLSLDGTTNSVWVGKKEQIFAAVGAQGFLLTSTKTLVIQNKQEVWVAPNGTACNLSILNERWESP